MDRQCRQFLASVPPLKRVWAASQEALKSTGGGSVWGAMVGEVGRKRQALLSLPLGALATRILRAP